MSEPSRQPGPRSLAGSVLLGPVAFSATLILLFGLSSVISRTAGDAGATPPVTSTQPAPTAVGPSMSAGTGSVSPSPSGDPVLVGAGDIADCGLDSGAAT